MSSYNYSYNVLINRFEAFAAGHLLIKRFTHGQIDLSDQLNDDQYPFMHVTPDTIEPVKGAIQFGFHIMFADIPRDKETKAEYQREVISDCVRLGQDLLAEIQNGLELFGFNVQLVNNVVFEPFMEEQKNTVTGVAFTVKLEVPWDWSACDIPAVWAVGGSSTGGSGTPIGILLQVNNVDNAVQSQLDLVAGTNVTLTDNGDGSVTIDATGGGGGGSGTVTSVALTAPAAFNVSGSPVTTSGTLALTAAGNGAQYIDGSGALQTFPTIPTALYDLSDVYIDTPNDGDILVYFAASNEWKNQVPVSGGTVTSVGLSMPAAFTVANSPVTTSGTLAVTGAGLSTDYIDGTGALQSFPALTGFVPYTGATQDVDLDTHKLSASSVYIEGTNGNGHLHLKHQNADATASGQSTALWADNNGDIKWKNDGNYKTTLKTSTNVFDRTYTFPDEDCTLMPRNTAITPGTATKITYDADGLVTAGASLAASDLPTGIDATKIGAGSVSDTEFGYLDGVTSSIQTQLNNKKDTISFAQVYTVAPIASSTVYAAVGGISTFNGTESNRQLAIAVGGTIKDFYASISTIQSATGSLVLNVRKNGANTGITITFTNADGAIAVKSDTTNTISVVPGDKIAFQIINNATVAGAQIQSMSFIIERS